MQDVDEPCFNKLGLRQRRSHAQDRLVGKEDRSFRHRMDVARKAKIGEVSKHARAEPAGVFEPADFVCAEAQILEELKCLFKAGGHQESTPRGKPANEQLKDRRLSLAMGEISLNHIELIEIGKQRARTRVHSTLIHRRCFIGRLSIVHGRCSFSPALYRSAFAFGLHFDLLA